MRRAVWCCTPAAIALGGFFGCAHGGDTSMTKDAAAVEDTRVCHEDAGFADGCGAKEIAFTTPVPAVAVLIDVSGSMYTPFAFTPFGELSRYEVVREALVLKPRGVLPLVEHEMRVGACTFWSNGGFGDPSAGCPIVECTPFALESSGSIEGFLSTKRPFGDTPTGESIHEVAVRLAAAAPTAPKFIVLATDGEPDTCDEPNPADPTKARQKSLRAVETASSAGIGTRVISVGDGVSADHLQDLANAGALPSDGPGKPKFYRALSAADVLAAFEEIVYGLRSCVLTLDGKVTTAGAGTVTIDCVPVYLDDPNGWRLNDATDAGGDAGDAVGETSGSAGNSELEFVGEACKRIKTGKHDVRVVFPCGVVIR